MSSLAHFTNGYLRPRNAFVPWAARSCVPQKSHPSWIPVPVPWGLAWLGYHTYIHVKKIMFFMRKAIFFKRLFTHIHPRCVYSNTAMPGISFLQGTWLPRGEEHEGWPSRCWFTQQWQQHHSLTKHGASVTARWVTQTQNDTQMGH